MDTASRMPKYLQVSNSLIQAIEQRRFAKGDQLPSIRELACILNISFDTAKKAYEVLKKMNIVTASHGKSNIINASGPLPAYRIFLLINELCIQKKYFYEALRQHLPSQALIDLHIYNNDPALFAYLLRNRKNIYTHHIVLPPFNCDNCGTAGLLNECLVNQQLILIDGKIDGVNIPHCCIYEDFEKDIYASMCKALPLLSRYQVFNVILPEENFHHTILTGFKEFCNEYGFILNVWDGVNSGIRINRGELFITLTDEDMVLLFDRLKKAKLETGKDVGIISYNDTPLKEVLMKGITTISPDFVQMGKLAATFLLNNEHETIAVPFELKLRSSL